MHATVERIYRAINHNDLDQLDDLFADGYIDHSEGYTGVEPLKQQMRAFRAAFPGPAHHC